MNFKRTTVKSFGYPSPYSSLELLIVLFTSLFFFSISSSFAQSHQKNEDLSSLNTSPYTLDSKEISQWFAPIGEIKSLALVTHGLNLKPSRMNEIVKTLTASGALVLRLSLSGHRGSKVEQLNVLLEQWLNSYELAINILIKKKKELEKHSQIDYPLYSFSYSLGSLIHLNAVMKLDQKIFKHSLMLAPAAWIKWYSYWAKILFFLPDYISIPSANHRHYRSQRGTSLASYRALYQGIDKWHNFHEAKSLKSIAPLTIIMDPEDELVSLDKIKEFLKKHPEIQANIIEIQNAQALIKPSFHHLIIDKKSVGEGQWSLIQGEIRSTLKK